MAWQKWLIIIGAIIAIIGQFAGGYYLPLIGGVLALIGALVPGK